MNRQLDDVVYNTLLELYLGEIGTCHKEERRSKETRALELLKRPEVCMCVRMYVFIDSGTLACAASICCLTITPRKSASAMVHALK